MAILPIDLLPLTAPLHAILLLSQQRLQEAYQVAINAVKGGGVVAWMVKAKVEQLHHQVRVAQRDEDGES